MNKRTPLYDLHVAAGAKVVPFHGWDMPLHYGSQLAEHKAVREDAGLFDVSHMAVVDIAGSGARTFLQYLLTNDVARLNVEGRALYTAMLNDEGGVLDDLIVYAMGTGYRLVINCGTRDSDIEWMRSRMSGYDAELRERPDLAIMALQGPNAEAQLQKVVPTHSDAISRLKVFRGVQLESWFVARTGYTGERGFELILPAAEAPLLWRKLVEGGVSEIGLGARDTLRLEAGMNLYGNDMDESVTPLESNMSAAVALGSERNFIGRAALEAQLRDGIKRQLVGIVMTAKGVIRAGTDVLLDGRPTGTVTSGIFSPTLGCSLALARVSAVDGSASVQIRGREMPVQIVKTPFVRNNERVYQPL